ncbi:MAG: hypothetical protein CXT73_06815 [Methanobacteriota archaeon]|nr:MAG: hypothetical protein CXT73_06815 [Euryarchaeota archaeon]
MTIIYEKNNIAIKLDKKSHYTFIIDDFNLYKHYHTNIIQTVKLYNYTNITSNNKENNIVILRFEAPDIIFLKDLLKSKQYQLGYKQCETLFLNLSEQIKSLEKDNFSNLFFNIGDIVVINSAHAAPLFLFLNTELFSPIKNNYIEITSPFMKSNSFISPELKLVKNLPSNIHFKSTYYSVGLLVCFCINKEDFEKKKATDFLEMINVIFNTKLYFALKRCFENKPDDRFLLYI